MNKLALTGNPIGHSLSPKLFEAAYSGTPEIIDRYRYDLVERATFKEAIEVIEREKYHAFNVTAPFKKEAYLLAQEREKCVEEVEAANLLIRSENGFKAYNTDYWGVRDMINRRVSSLKLNPSDINLLVIGCGGAGRAAAIASRDMGLETVVSNRNYEKCISFCNKNRVRPTPFEKLPEIYYDFDIIIYTLPLFSPIADQIKKSDKTVIEANYKDPSINNTGYEWLYSQALTGFYLMTGQKPDKDRMKMILTKDAK